MRGREDDRENERREREWERIRGWERQREG